MIPRSAHLVLVAALLCGASCAKEDAPPVLIEAFPSDAAVIAADRALPEDDGWRIAASEPGAVRLFEVDGELCEDCRLLYRAQVRTQDLAEKAYLEMWVRIPGQGEFFSRGLDQPVSGTSNWASLEIPFFLQKGQRPEVVKLNVVFESSGGSLSIKDIELWSAPLP